MQIDLVARSIFQHLPQLNVRTGNTKLTQSLTGAYVDRYYFDPIEKSARLTHRGYTSEQEQRRLDQLVRLRTRGKGPPKKGAGKRQQKRKKT